MALSEVPAWSVHTLTATVNHSRTIDLSNRVVQPLLMSGVQVYSVALLSTLRFKWMRWCFLRGLRQQENERCLVWLSAQSPRAALHLPAALRPFGFKAGERAGATGREEAIGWWWGLLDGWGHAVGRTGPWKFPFVCFSFLGWEGFGMGGWWRGWGGGGGGCCGCGWVRVWGLGCEPDTAGSLLVSHGQKSSLGQWLAIWAQHSSHHPKKKNNRNSEMWCAGWWHRLTAAYSQLHSIVISTHVIKAKLKKAREDGAAFFLASGSVTSKPAFDNVRFFRSHQFTLYSPDVSTVLAAKVSLWVSIKLVMCQVTMFTLKINVPSAGL